MKEDKRVLAIELLTFSVGKQLLISITRPLMKNLMKMKLVKVKLALHQNKTYQ